MDGGTDGEREREGGRREVGGRGGRRNIGREAGCRYGRKKGGREREWEKEGEGELVFGY
jgi:hypothetical protein